MTVVSKNCLIIKGDNKKKELKENGYAIARQLIGSQEIERLKDEIAQNLPLSSTHGTRNLSNKLKSLDEIVNSSCINKFLSTYFESQNFQLVRMLYFNKTKQANWGVPWHQDKTIAVRERIEFTGFTAWSIKQGVVHVQPPLEVMKNILTVRVHLDAATEENGALRVIPGSHQLGILTQSQIEPIKNNLVSIACRVNAGDVTFMSPLLLHSSRKATKPSDRRTIHLEYFSGLLPNHLIFYYK
ncbi:MAG: phytanoyl-CoA dioxygenase family protein [Hydrococcus sp. Prado102]|jgi:ectoine hydroxylase-related dioxygenase (phytanoyl-CoA dioxygenase family)|nr:phytanoyl-CoA dioxygenase family protein [Hydrococcus sp. Prado102]